MTFSLTMKRSWRLLAMLVICTCVNTQQTSAVNIDLVYRSGGQAWRPGSGEGDAAWANHSKLHGSASFGNVISAAASAWESALDFNYDLKIYWGFDTNSDTGSGNLASAEVEDVDGNFRIDKGILRINNTKHFYVDGNPSTTSSEWARTAYSTYRSSTGQLLNVGKESYGGLNGNVSNYHDLYSVVLHEMGHLLGIASTSSGYTKFAAETNADNEIDFHSPLAPYTGIVIPTITNSDGAHFESNENFGRAIMTPGISAGIRRNFSDADILAIAEVGDYPGGISDVDLNSVPSRNLFYTSNKLEMDAGHSNNSGNSNAMWNIGGRKPGEAEPTVNKHKLYDWEGVVIPTIATNSPIIANIDRNSDRSGSTALNLVVKRIDNSGLINADVDLAYFTYANSWKAGHALRKSGNSYEFGFKHGSFEDDDIHNMGNGRARVEIDGVSNWSSGMLFVTGGGDGGNNNYVSTNRSSSHSDSWDVAVRDRTHGFANFSHSDFSFVYMPYSAPEMEAGGLIGSTGSVLRHNNGSGSSSQSFTLDHVGTGQYNLFIPGYRPSDGVLMLTPHEAKTVSGTTRPTNNTFTYQAMFNAADGWYWRIQSREMTGSGNTSWDNAGFVFAFLPTSNGAFAVPEPASIFSMLIGIGLLAGLRFRKRKTA